jgi:hypothetical protein
MTSLYREYVHNTKSMGGVGGGGGWNKVGIKKTRVHFLRGTKFRWTGAYS